MSENLIYVPSILTEQSHEFSGIFTNNKGQIYLTAKEFDLFYFLYSHRGQVFSKEQIISFSVLNLS
ncbi:winged helix-turn-helix domain-containing protein [Robinsoniella peoriensis]|uniref:winged helix-turn-helix domain-containing protein n=1 Tax=Robinsoniella peoriensis TaxID=180332 RepID=UPI00237C09FB|nr:winged helix-turn-helix domain-containing protein [Robinsoniella peoriensis]MDU7029491.1 winged helix-turn-helix domain-containing protein [Clostridiales bacterium]